MKQISTRYIKFYRGHKYINEIGLEPSRANYIIERPVKGMPYSISTKVRDWHYPEQNEGKCSLWCENPPIKNPIKTIKNLDEKPERIDPFREVFEKNTYIACWADNNVIKGPTIKLRKK